MAWLVINWPIRADCGPTSGTFWWCSSLFLLRRCLIFCLFAPLTGQCLKLTRVEVPSMVAMGEPFWLNCSYDLGNQGLYSIKWYHWNPDSSVNGEFYRWVPNDTPPGQMFPLKGVHLDVSSAMQCTASYFSELPNYTLAHRSINRRLDVNMAHYPVIVCLEL